MKMKAKDKDWMITIKTDIRIKKIMKLMSTVYLKMIMMMIIGMTKNKKQLQ